MTITADVDAFLDATPQIIHPSASPEQAALLAWAYSHPTPRPPAERTGNGRYKLPHPDTGKPATWTRATNYAGTLDDSAGLQVWRDRLLVKGLAAGDAFDGCADYEDGAQLSRLAARALHRAGEKLGADVGTALHTAVEHLILGTGERPPDPWGADVDAYASCLERHDLVAEPGQVERIVLTPEIGVAGTVDSFVWSTRFEGLRIGDLKTGKKATRLAYAAQLAIYAHGTHVWRLDGEGYEPMWDTIDTDTAYIFHMPAGSGTCELVEVDIHEGWHFLVNLCGDVRHARSDKFQRGLFGVVPATRTPGERVEWIKGRLAAIAETDHGKAVEAVRKFWPADVPTPKHAATWTDEHIDTLDAFLAQIETSVDEVPFPALDPNGDDPNGAAGRAVTAARDALAASNAANPLLRPLVDDGKPATPDNGHALKAIAKTLTDEQRRIIAAWKGDARRAGCPWVFDKGATRRVAAVTAAAFAAVLFLVDSLDDSEDAVRAALAIVLGVPLEPAWSTGAILGSLTTHEADALSSLATRHGASDPEALTLIGERLASIYATTAQ